MNLELKHLVPYLPYGVKMTANGFVGILRTICIDPNMASGYRIQVSCSDWWENNNLTGKIYKPILRPLSDLTKEIEVNGERFVPIIWLSKNISHVKLTRCITTSDKIVYYNETTKTSDCLGYEYGLILKLLSWHFDVFGLINAGLAIDINTLEPCTT